MKKKFIGTVIALSLFCSCFALVGCGNGNGDTEYDTDIRAVYEMYVANAQGSDGAPLSYEEWLESIKGENGVSISKIEKTSSNGHIDTYTIFLSDGTTTTFTVTNGTALVDIDPQELDYYPLDDGSYAVAAGRATSLSTIYIPATHFGKPVTAIWRNGFQSCYDLKKITVPDSVTTIGDGAFTGCSKLTSITLPAGITSIGKEAFKGCKGLTSAPIPSSVTSIGDSAFEDCSNMASITIPDGVTSIGREPFTGTAYYRDSSNWQNGVLYIGKHLIRAAKASLSQAYSIKSGTVTIASEAFRNCTDLTSIAIPSSVKHISSYAFSSCPSLTSMTVDSGNEVYKCTGNCIIEKASKTLVLGCKTSAMPTDGSVTSIGAGAFDGSAITTFTIPACVTSIGQWAFAGCDKLTSITFAVTTGWKVSGGNGDTPITPQSLADPAQAVQLLKFQYAFCEWKRD